MISNELWEMKLSAIGKRSQSFIQDYRQNIAVLGNDSDEVSYVLEKYLEKNRLDEITYVRTKSYCVSQKDFFKSVVVAILSEYTQSAQTLDELIVATQESLVNTTNFAKDILKKDKLFFLDVLELVNKFINETDRYCMLVIEEFSKLKDIFPHYTQAFSKFIILQKKCMVILTSSQVKEARRILSAELNLLFGDFEQINISEGDFIDNYLYFKNLLNDINPSPFLMSFFIDIIGSNISYYDLIAPVIKNSYHEGREDEAIVTALKESLYDSHTYFSQKFAKKIEMIEKDFKNSWVVFKILAAINDGYIRRSEITSLNICSPREIKTKLQKLVQLNYIEDFGNIYKITDSLFAFWFSNVFSVSHFSSCFDSTKRMQIWKNKTYQYISDSKESFFKDGIKKILELLSSFKDDTLRWGKNQYKLPLVDRLKMISYPERNLHLVIGEGKGIVFAGVKEDDVDDADMFDFLEKGRGLSSQNMKKIFISFKRFSSTAKLIAKDHKVMAWDVDEVNHLLDIYHKPSISLEAVKAK